MKSTIFFLILVFFFLIPVLAQVSEFEISHPFIKSTITSGDNFSQTINLINFDKDKDFFISIKSETDFILLEKNKIFIKQKEQKGFIIHSREFLDLGIYVGRILIKGYNEQEIPVVLEVESKKPLFDSSLEANFNGNNEISTSVKIFNLGAKNASAKLKHQVFDFSGRILFSQVEDIEVTNHLETSKIIKLDNLSGKYLVAVSVYTKDSVGTSSEIVDTRSVFIEGNRINILFFFLAIIIFILFILGINYYWNKRIKEVSRNWSNELVEYRKIKFGNVSREIRSLKKKLFLLELAKEKKYIKQSSYLEARREINEIIRKLKKRL